MRTARSAEERLFFARHGGSGVGLMVHRASLLDEFQEKLEAATLEGRRDILRKAICSAKNMLVTHFLEACSKRDHEALRELADYYARRKRPASVDSVRELLALLTIVLDWKTWPDGTRICFESVGQLADAINYTGDLPTLARIAHEMNFPLAKKPLGRPRGNSANKPKKSS